MPGRDNAVGAMWVVRNEEEKGTEESGRVGDGHGEGREVKSDRAGGTRE